MCQSCSSMSFVSGGVCMSSHICAVEYMCTSIHVATHFCSCRCIYTPASLSSPYLCSLPPWLSSLFCVVLASTLIDANQPNSTLIGLGFRHRWWWVGWRTNSSSIVLYHAVLQFECRRCAWSNFTNLCRTGLTASFAMMRTHAAITWLAQA